MKDKRKETEKECSICFEAMPFAEMMGKMMAGQGVGSLCAEMMQKVADQQATGGPFDCAGMMEKMMTMCRGLNLNQEDQKTPRE